MITIAYCESCSTVTAAGNLEGTQAIHHHSDGTDHLCLFADKEEPNFNSETGSVITSDGTEITSPDNWLTYLKNKYSL